MDGGNQPSIHNWGQLVGCGQARIDDLIQAKTQPVHARYPEQRAPAAALKQPEAAGQCHADQRCVRLDAGTGRQLQAVWRQLQQERVLRLQADKKYERVQLRVRVRAT